MGGLNINGQVQQTLDRKIYKSQADTILCEITENGVSIDKTDFLGANNTRFSTEAGLYTIGRQFIRLRDCSFRSFKGYAGLRVGHTVGTHSTLTASDLLFLSNKIGFLSEERGEYVVIANSQFNGNEIAARIQGGNVQLTNCMINDNINGIEILGGSNDSHGIISNCQINHNSGIALLIDGISNGETITSCHFYDCTIHIKNTVNKPVRFNNCVIAGKLIIENSAKVIFSNCFFPSGYGLLNSIISNAVVEGNNNEVEEREMEKIFNTK
ncbi:MAG: hypothetical protein WAP19_02245 [Caldicoprobacterales bacterium]